MTRTVNDVLRSIETQITEHPESWIRGRMSGPNGAHCLLGWAMQATDYLRLSPDAIELYHDTVLALKTALRKRTDNDYDLVGIPTWNDERATDASDVVKLLQEAQAV